MANEIIYFHLNHWWEGDTYPNDEPYRTWMYDYNLYDYLGSDEFCKKNKICVVSYPVDMSISFNVTATKKWVEENCPTLLTKYRKFLVAPDENGILKGPYTLNSFLEYKEENFGCHEEDGFLHGPYTDNEFLEYKEENIGLHFEDPHGGSFGETFGDDEDESE